jgi:alpha-tubulin suppressor-like RCC1 family protein
MTARTHRGRIGSIVVLISLCRACSDGRLAEAPHAEAPDAGAPDAQGPDDADAEAPGLLPCEATGGHAIQIAAGDEHTCALFSSGEVRCWGGNLAGQSSGSIGQSLCGPTRVPIAPCAKSIALGAESSCALSTSGYALCWGDDVWGELGDNFTGDGIPRLTSAASQIACGGVTCAALMVSGAIDIWGRWGTTFCSPYIVPTPQPFGALRDVAQVTASVFGCALLTDGTVHCWGPNESGELGDSTTTPGTQPTTVVGLDGVVQVEAGSDFACVVRSDGSAWCWGANDQGQLGDGTTQQRHTPVKVVDIDTAVQVALGSACACARLQDGTLRCWGSNQSGALGSGSMAMQSLIPSTVQGISSAVDIAAGACHACALEGNGRAFCWGCNESGQLGNFAIEVSAVPMEVMW